MLCCRIISVRCVRSRGMVLLPFHLYEDREEITYLTIICHQITRGMMYGAGIEEEAISIFHIVRCYAYDIPPND